MTQPIRVLVAKPGLDGHDRGALVIAQGLRDEGMEVIYSGLRQTPEQIVATAIQEDVACIGLSSLSGAHMPLFTEVLRLLREQDAEDILVIGGGVIPEEDCEVLRHAGIGEVFTPGTNISDVASFIRSNVKTDFAGFPSRPLAEKIDHVAVAVTSLEDALPFYTQVLGLSVVHQEVIESQKVKAVFLEVGGIHLELLEPTATDSPIQSFLEKRGPGIHHIAYKVEDTAVALAEAQSKGLKLIDEQPRSGGQGKLIGFVHPKSTTGVLTEFCQWTETEAENP